MLNQPLVYIFFQTLLHGISYNGWAFAQRLNRMHIGKVNQEPPSRRLLIKRIYIILLTCKYSDIFYNIRRNNTFCCTGINHNIVNYLQLTFLGSIEPLILVACSFNAKLGLTRKSFMKTHVINSPTIRLSFSSLRFPSRESLRRLLN